MNGTEGFKEGEFHGKVLGELDALKIGQEATHDRINSLHESLDQFKSGLGSRVENQGLKIVEIETQQGIMGKIMWIIGSAAVTALLAAIFKLVIK